MTDGNKAVRLIDAHCHLNFNAYRNDLDAVAARSLEQGIGFVVVGSQSTTSRRAVDLAEKYDGAWAIIGLHPIHLFAQEIDEEEDEFISRSESFDPEFYRRLARSSRKVVAIGECGLDYFHLPKDVPAETVKAEQARVFRAQLDLALELDLAVMIHSRDSADDIIKILEEYRVAGKSLRGDVHCFSGGWSEAERYLNLGLHISFTGIVSFPPRAADKKAGKETLADVAKKVPLERLLVETDAPYLAPVPFRGKRNEPAYVQYVAAEIAKIKGLSVSEVESQTLHNTRELFRLA